MDFTACVVLLQLVAAAAPAGALAQIQDLNITDLVLCDGKGGGGKAAPTIVWSPSIVVTSQNTTLAVAQAQWKQGRNVVKAEMDLQKQLDQPHLLDLQVTLMTQY